MILSFVAIIWRAFRIFLHISFFHKRMDNRGLFVIAKYFLSDECKTKRQTFVNTIKETN